MFSPLKRIHVYRSQIGGKSPLRDWVCEWKPLLHATPSRGGKFLVKGAHPLDARQTAKKVLRDTIVFSREFIFKVREPGLIERVQLKFARIVRRQEVKTLADGQSARSTSKT